jgi:hypothetical protein
VLVVSAVLVISTGVATLAKGRLGYRNYLGLTVFVPFAIVLGLVLLFVLLLRRTKSLE